MYCLLRHLGIRSCQCFQGFVWMRISLTTQDCLYGFGHHSPCIVQILGYLITVKYELAQAFQRTLYSYHAMSEGHTDIAKNRRIGQIALQTAHRQLLNEELQDGIGYTEIALTVLEVNRIHLVRHST